MTEANKDVFTLDSIASDKKDSISQEEIDRLANAEIQGVKARVENTLRLEEYNRKLDLIMSKTLTAKEFIAALYGNSKDFVNFAAENVNVVRFKSLENMSLPSSMAQVTVDRDMILNFLRSKVEPVSAEDIAIGLKISKENLKAPLKNLVGLGVVLTEGQRRGTKYFVPKDLKMPANVSVTTETPVEVKEEENKPQPIRCSPSFILTDQPLTVVLRKPEETKVEDENSQEVIATNVVVANEDPADVSVNTDNLILCSGDYDAKNHQNDYDAKHPEETKTEVPILCSGGFDLSTAEGQAHYTAVTGKAGFVIDDTISEERLRELDEVRASIEAMEIGENEFPEELTHTAPTPEDMGTMALPKVIPDPLDVSEVKPVAENNDEVLTYEKLANDNVYTNEELGLEIPIVKDLEAEQNSDQVSSANDISEDLDF